MKIKTELQHLFDHLMDNEIYKAGDTLEGWYYGNKEQFIKRHRKLLTKIYASLHTKIKE